MGQPLGAVPCRVTCGNGEGLGYSIQSGQGNPSCDARLAGDRGEPKVQVLQAAFCVVPKAAVTAMLGPVRGANEVHM